MININHALKESLVSLGGDLSKIGSSFTLNIEESYQEPQRHYHTVQHINECLDYLVHYEVLADNLHEVTVALLMHDLVYNPRAKNNELLSADYTLQLMKSAGISQQSCLTIYQHIMATAAHLYVDNVDTCLVMDIDMLILGSDQSRLLEYENQIRQEYSHVPGFIYRVKRKSVLKGFLKQEFIFNVLKIRNIYEQKARDNINYLCNNIL
ncbi:hypothetical protein MNBD_GAMMA12-2411 [hydrothermal vent metagenome]|uniref:Uncharacterized protein n=1 Tax=hydrothermal vent metagenome TaxID=652676 RepID=A0A3B0YZS9_9ZZZZ